MTCKNMLHNSREGLMCVDSLNHDKDCQNVITTTCRDCGWQQDLKCKVCLICHPNHDDSNTDDIGSGCYSCAEVEREWKDFEREVYNDY